VKHKDDQENVRVNRHVEVTLTFVEIDNRMYRIRSTVRFTLTVCKYLDQIRVFIRWIISVTYCSF